MEKLQAALEKARDKRENIQESSAAPQVRTRGKPTTREERWQAIAPFQVSDQLLETHRVVTREASPSAAPFDILRTKLLIQMRQNGWRRLAITSPMPNAGKTTVACNLALGLGRQRDMHSILMDLDLRSPSVSNFFETKPPQDIGKMLTRKVPFEEQALRFGENVICSMSGTPDHDPTRLLLAEESSEVIDEIEVTYDPDLIIFDLPSVLVNDDTRAFLKNVDCALIVARTNTTRYSQLDVCEREVAEQTNVLGTVLNAYPFNEKS